MVTSFLDAERTRRAIGSVVVPFGTCSEPTNVAASGGTCPLRFRCVGCDHFALAAPRRICGDWDPAGRSVTRSAVERMERYGKGELDLEFRQIAITADDVRSGRLTTHDVSTRDVNFVPYREESLREGIDPHTAVEVEALRPGLLRRLDETIEGLVDDVRSGTSRPAPKSRAGTSAVPARSSEGDRPPHRRRPGRRRRGPVAAPPLPAGPTQGGVTHDATPLPLSKGRGPVVSS